MVKKIITIIIIIAIIVIGIVVKNSLSIKKIDYVIPQVENYLYVKYKNEDKYGVLDRDGNILIEAKYQEIQIPNPEKDIFVCYENDQEIIVFNSKKEQLFKEYESVEAIKLKNIASVLCFEKSVLKFKKDGLYGIIDFDGNQIIKNQYDEIENLASVEGKMLIKKASKYGIININGTVLVEPKYDKIETDGYYDNEKKYVEAGFIISNTTNEGYRYGYIDYKGKQILNFEFNSVTRITDKSELFLIASKGGKYGLYKEKNTIIKDNYQSISYTDNGAIIIEKNKQFGIANLNGEIKVEAKYDSIEGIGIYVYAQNEKQKDVYDKDGNKLDVKFDKSVYKTNNENYYISTFVNNDVVYYSIEDKDGKELAGNFKYIEYLFKDLFLAENENNKYGVINAKGGVKINFENDLIQKIKDKNIIQISNYDDKNIRFYSVELENTTSMDSSRLDINSEYVKIYNENGDEAFLDNDGNLLEKNSDYIKNALKRELPETINNYKKYQYSLDDVYYIE